MQVGELRLLPKGTMVWSIDLQATISFSKDHVIEITNTIYGEPDFFFAKRKIQLSSSLMDAVRGALGSVKYSDTQPYELPPPFPLYVDFKYEQ